MGIRFLCPHCQQRLNVKAAQAGLNGECPLCEKPIRVPLESTSSSSGSSKKIKRSKLPPRLDVENQITESGLDLATQLATKSSSDYLGATLPNSTERSPVFGSTVANSPESFLLDKPQPPSTLGKIDPIVEAPQKIWYFRSRELGEEGPLKSRQMQQMLDEGKVTIGCIVWREDWDDWQPAEKVFPSLVGAIKEARYRQAMEFVPESFRPNSRVRRRLRMKRRNRWWVVIALLAGMLMVAGLVYIVIQLTSPNVWG